MKHNKIEVMSKPANEYKDYYTKDIKKWGKFYQSQTTSYAYEPELPNRPLGKTKAE